jgi:restriction system protein
VFDVFCVYRGDGKLSLRRIGNIEIALILAIIIAFCIWRAPRNTAAAKGRRGERKVSRRLSDRLGEQYRVIDDVTLPTDTGTAQIDHIVVSPYGVFAIETKNYSGWIFGGEDQANWTQVIYKEKNKFQNPLRQNRHHIKTLQTLFELRPNQTHGYVVFTGSGEFKTEVPPKVAKGARQLISNIKQHTKRILSDYEAERIVCAIQSTRLEPSRETDRIHVQNAKEGALKRAAGCPRCGSEITERINRQTDERFLGCTRYPHCKGTRPLPAL